MNLSRAVSDIPLKMDRNSRSKFMPSPNHRVERRANMRSKEATKGGAEGHKISN